MFTSLEGSHALMKHRSGAAELPTKHIITGVSSQMKIARVAEAIPVPPKDPCDDFIDLTDAVEVDVQWWISHLSPAKKIIISPLSSASFRCNIEGMRESDLPYLSAYLSSFPGKIEALRFIFSPNETAAVFFVSLFDQTEEQSFNLARLKRLELIPTRIEHMSAISEMLLTLTQVEHISLSIPDGFTDWLPVLESIAHLQKLYKMEFHMNDPASLSSLLLSLKSCKERSCKERFWVSMNGRTDAGIYIFIPRIPTIPFEEKNTGLQHKIGFPIFIYHKPNQEISAVKL